MTAASPTTRYVVAAGDTLSGIAARFAVRGGWPALYAANRPAIGPDPDIIHPGTVLVLPGRMAPVRYTVAAGDTLSGIAAEFAVRGGWPALYAANRRAIGPDPNDDPRRDRAHGPAPRGTGAPRAGPGPTAGTTAGATAVSAGGSPAPSPAGDTGSTGCRGMPQWLKTMLLAVGLLVLAAFLAEPVLVVRRRRQQAAVRALPPRTAVQPGNAVPEPGKAVPGPRMAVSGACDGRLRAGHGGSGPRAGLLAARRREGSHRPGRL